MNTGKRVNEPIEGDYYGVIYKGSLILPIIGIVLAISIWWYLKKRK